ncbi:MAG: 2-pyrone-4,6-dicarboxylate hydrolase [Alphaproteobacteria bacterium]|nr:2-pyrone-4,6-dicarboxylate hydrolase [Alphaproteobacteria bacterium]
MQVPNSSGTAAPKLKAPPGACDCHMHLYDGARFPPPRPQARMQDGATVADYRLFQQRIGTSRVVVVQPAAYGTDNAVTLDALAQLGGAARGIAVVHPDVAETELRAMDTAGICGIRFTQFDPRTAATTIDMVEPLAKRVEPLGWHVQIHLRSDQIVDAADMLQRLPGTVVFDHLGRLSPQAGTNDPAFAIIRRMLDRGRTWMKLSGAYMFGAGPRYTEAAAIARAYMAAAPERMVWGSDWPHPTEAEKPDDAVLFDLLSEWAPDAAAQQRILVDNPARLYGF